MADEAPSIHALQRALSQAVAGVFAEFYGKGPARTRTHVFDDIAFSICDDVLTPAEQTLIEAGEGELVQDVRLTFQDLMTEAFVAEVQRLTARTVVGYHSQVLVEHGVAIELFVLDAPMAGDDARQPSGPGPLRAAIGNAVGKVLYDLYGRGPARTRVHLADDVVLCALEDPLTTVEQTLVEGGRTDLVRRLRRGFVQATAPRLQAEVQALVERPVAACQSQVVFDPDILFLTFLLGAR